MTEAAHSLWSASKFESLMLCPGKIVLEEGKPNSTSKYAAEGTAAHQVLTWALQEERPAGSYVGRVIEADGFTFEVDEDMARHVQVCIDYVRDLTGDDGIVFADIRVNYAQYLDTPEAEAWGTADVIIARGAELIVIDFKYGMGVEVSAEKNPQMSLYGLGALQQYHGVVADFERVRMAISQPRIKTAPSEYDISVEELEAWGRSTARSAVNSCKVASEMASRGLEPVEQSWEQTFLRPGEKQCKFCKAKATCPAVRAEVAETIEPIGSGPATPDEFASMDCPPPEQHSEGNWLSACLSKVDLIEDWCKAVRAEVERRLLAGDNVPGYKLVEGKQGNRAWANEKEAEALLKSMRLKEAELYDFSVKSPTQIAKLGPVFDKDGKIKPQKEGTPPPVIGPRQWPKVAALITRAGAKKHVAPVSDPRPALVVTPVADDFTDVTTANDLA